METVITGIIQRPNKVRGREGTERMTVYRWEGVH